MFTWFHFLSTWTGRSSTRDGESQSRLSSLTSTNQHTKLMLPARMQMHSELIRWWPSAWLKGLFWQPRGHSRWPGIQMYPGSWGRVGNSVKTASSSSSSSIQGRRRHRLKKILLSMMSLLFRLMTGYRRMTHPSQLEQLFKFRHVVPSILSAPLGWSN